MYISASLVLYNNNKQEILTVVDCVINSMIERLVVVDQSPNDYYRFLEKCSDKILYVHNENKGYGAGHNLAVRIVCSERQSEYHVVLNPDIYFSNHCISILANYMFLDAKIGLLMPKVYYPDGRLQYLCKLLPTPLDIISRLFFNGKKFVRRYKRMILYSSNYDKIMNIPYLSGCFMFFRTEAFIEIGGFDERFFMHFEDLDLSRRMHERYKTLFIPDEKIVHNHAASQRKSCKMMFVALMSAIKYFNKWGWFWDSRRRVINRKTIAFYTLNSTI
ncbi:glycosyltransferase [Bacteroides sp. GD17]|jgi:GT2 family glycosyltransferase|uniref:glycosyltransferase n=1 Tax=Bacteroides sp. GD17 TaxID=3139826 RepID=UPI00313D06ED